MFVFAKMSEKYTVLPSDEPQDEIQMTTPRGKCSSMYWRTARDVLIYIFAFWGLLSILLQTARTRHLRPNETFNSSTQPLECDCGSSVADAISLGCKFDPLSMAWLPEHCRDDELTAEFTTAGDGPDGNWLYYADTNHTILMSEEEVAAMGDDPTQRVHMGTAWHRVHCVFYWRKAYRTRFTGKIVEPRSDSESHIKHCGMVFADPGYGTVSGVALNTNED